MTVVAAAETSPTSHRVATPRRHGALALSLGALGVVYGDIGTSPLYAFRLALQQAAKDGLTQSEVYGVVSLALWALILVVTVKYVVFIMRADNGGEGGVLSLMALAERAVGKRTPLLLLLGLCGAALFYGDAAITPAISVLSAIEGLKSIPAASAISDTTILIASLVVLVLLFAVQSRGTAKIAACFGPVMLVWFASLTAMGVAHIAGSPSILLALSPSYAAGFLLTHGLVGFLVLGSVFLTVTGAEALFADMGHFGRWPIQAAWLFVALPALAINYLGQGGMALKALAAAQAAGRPVGDVDWFFTMAPVALRAPMIVLALAATIIASQAVITGAYSLTQQAIQLGFLPRLAIRNTSERHSGQIYLPAVNTILAIAVVFLVAVFRHSSALGDAYGLAVTGTMVVTTTLAFIVARRLWRWRLVAALALVAPLLALDVTFLAANALKIPTGGWLPLTIALALMAVMLTWVKGSEVLTAKLRGESVPLRDILPSIERRVRRVPGTAVFLTSDPETTPSALLHNIKHNQVLHEANVILTIETTREPREAPDDRAAISVLDDSFKAVRLRYGFMEQPDLPADLQRLRGAGLNLDLLTTSFFVKRSTIVKAAGAGLPLWRKRIFMFLMKNREDPTVYFRIPPGRVVELGSQISI